MGRALTDIERIKSRIRDSIDLPYNESLYRQGLMLVGADPVSPIQGSEDLPWYPDITLTDLEIGRSRRMLSSVHIIVSRLLSSELAVEIQNVPDEVEEVIKSYFRVRMEGEDGGWDAEVTAAGRDGNSLGMGVCQIALETEPKTGLQKIVVKNHRPWHVINDAAQRNVLKSKFVCFVHHMSTEDAEELFGDDCEEYERTVRDNPSSPKRKVVRVFEYYDLADKKTKATRALILGSIDSGKYKIEENLFECLPVAYCTGYESAVQGRPYGRVLNEIATEEAIHKLERRWEYDLTNGIGAYVVDMTSLEENDVRQWAEGVPNTKIRQKKALAENPIKIVPSQPIDPAIAQQLQYQISVYNQMSGITELDRGIAMSRRTTATEIDSLQAKSQQNRGSEAKQITLFLRRLAEVVIYIGRKFDKAPLSVKLKDTQIKINDPATPGSWIDTIIGDYDYRVFVDAEALTKADNDYKKAMELAALRELAPLVGQTIDPVKYTALILDAMGRGDDGLQITPPSAPVPTPEGNGLPSPMPSPAAQMMAQGGGQGSITPTGGVPRVEDIVRAGMRQAS